MANMLRKIKPEDAVVEEGMMMSSTASKAMQERYASHLAKQRELAPKVNNDMIKAGPTGFKSGETKLGPELDVIILGFSYTASFYGIDNVYDPDNTELPVCYAVGNDPDDLVPCDSVEQETVEADTCSECWASKFKSASQGKGKACREYIKLAVLSVDDIESGAAPKVMNINLPPTARKGFGAFVANVNGAFRVPLFGVITRLSIMELKAGFSIDVEMLGVIDDEAVVANIIEPLLDDVEKRLFEDPKFSEMDIDDGAPEKPVEKAPPKKRTAKPKAKAKVVEPEVEATEPPDEDAAEEANFTDAEIEELENEAPTESDASTTRGRTRAAKAEAVGSEEEGSEQEEAEEKPVVEAPIRRTRRAKKF